MKLKRAVQSILFCIIFILITSRVYQVLSWKDTGGDYLTIFNDFYHMEDNLIDVLFMGSSRCYCAIDNSRLWTEYGIASFNFSISGQDLVSTYYCLAEALKTQKPKVVCIESYGAVFEGYQSVGNLYRNTLPLKLSANSYEAVQNLITDGNPMDYWLKWPIIHTRYSELKARDFEKDLPVYLGYQADFHTEEIQGTPLYIGDEAIPTAEKNEEYLGKIIALAKDHDISLCFFVAPYAAPDTDQRIYRYVEQIARANGADFLNMLALKEELGMDTHTDYNNWFHTNYFGAEKVTHYMGEYLKAHYALPDRRDDVRYHIWDEDAVVRFHEVQNELTIRRTSDVINYLNLIPGLKGYTVFISTEGDYLSGDADIFGYLNGIGISEEFYSGRHVWIWEDGQITYVSPETDFLQYGDLPYSEYAVSGSQADHTILISRTPYQKTTDGINIIIYDNILGEVADAVGFYAPGSYAMTR